MDRAKKMLQDKSLLYLFFPSFCPPLMCALFPCSLKRFLFPCSLRYFALVPLFPSEKWPCSLVPQNPWETLTYDLLDTGGAKLNKQICGFVIQSSLSTTATFGQDFLAPS